MEHTSPVSSGIGDVCRHAGARLRRYVPAWRLLVTVLLVSQAAFADRFAPAVVPFHFEHGFAVVVPVSINGSGPYPFLLDTGATITALDRGLAEAVVLDGSGMGTVTTLAETMSVSLAVAHTVSIGPVTERNVEVMVRDLKGLHAFAPGVRGVLGQNALNHADFLLDYRRRTLAFDMDGALLASLNGHHMQLTRETVEDNPQYANLAVHATIASDGVHPMDFLLDSGTASLVLFDGRFLDARTSVKDIKGARAQRNCVRSNC